MTLLTWINQPCSQSLRITAITIPKQPFFSLMVLNRDNQVHNQLKVPRRHFKRFRNEVGTIAFTVFKQICLSSERNLGV